MIWTSLFLMLGMYFGGAAVMVAVCSGFFGKGLLLLAIGFAGAAAANFFISALMWFTRHPWTFASFLSWYSESLVLFVQDEMKDLKDKEAQAKAKKAPDAAADGFILAKVKRTSLFFNLITLLVAAIWTIFFVGHEQLTITATVAILATLVISPFWLVSTALCPGSSLRTNNVVHLVHDASHSTDTIFGTQRTERSPQV